MTESYLKDGTEFSDEVKILYNILEADLNQFLKSNRKFWVVEGLAISVAVVGVFLLLFPETDVPYEIDNNFDIIGKILTGLGIGFALYAITLKPSHSSLKIDKLDMAYIPIRQTRFQSGSIWIDEAGLLPPSHFKFTCLQDQDIELAYQSLEKLKTWAQNVPLLLGEDRAQKLDNFNSKEFTKEGNLMFEEELVLVDLLSNFKEIFERAEEQEVGISAFPYSGSFNIIKDQFSTVSSSTFKVLPKADDPALQNNLEKINGIIKIDATSVDVDDIALDVLLAQEDILPRMDYVIDQSNNEIFVDHLFNFSQMLEKSNFNHYCPSCNEDAIQTLEKFEYWYDGETDHRVSFDSNTKMKLTDVGSAIWTCPQCSSNTDDPYPRHKLEDELFIPVYDKLYEENYLERLKVYRSIADQKRQYGVDAEKTLHEFVRESTSQVNQIKSKVRSITAEIRADQSSVEEMNKMLLKYEHLNAEKARQISADLERHRKEVEAANKKSAAEIGEIVSKTVGDIDRNVKKYANLERIDQTARDKVQKDIAQNTKQTARNTRQTAKNTSRIARNTKRTARNTKHSALKLKRLDQRDKARYNKDR